MADQDPKDPLMDELRAEWRDIIGSIDDRIRKLDANQTLMTLDRESGEAVRHWRYVLVGWRDELMDMLRRNTGH